MYPGYNPGYLKIKYMKYLILIELLFLFTKCNSQMKNEFNESALDDILSSEKKYYKYFVGNLTFKNDAIYLDSKDSVINQSYFFEQIFKKSFFPLKSKKQNKFKLFLVKDWPNKIIKEWIVGDAYRNFKTVSLVGKKFIDSPFQDLDGVLIDSNSVKNKVVFVKIWFIACAPCIAEMPKLNEIVSKNINNNQLLFLSLAFDDTNPLKKFIGTHTFAYKVCSVPKKYIFDTLGIMSFPTHFVYHELPNSFCCKK